MARFLVDASLPRHSSEIARALGHEAVDVRDIGLGSAEDSAVARFAKENRLCLLTRDRDFGNILAYPPEEYFGLVVFRLPDWVKRSEVLRVLREFLKNPFILGKLPGRLAVVDVHQVRLRPGEI